MGQIKNIKLHIVTDIKIYFQTSGCSIDMEEDEVWSCKVDYNFQRLYQQQQSVTEDTNWYLLQHSDTRITSDTTDSSKPFPCVICHRTFAARYRLKRHMLVHNDDKPY